MTMSEAAKALDCDASNITLLARRLERPGLTEHIPDPEGRRARRLRLTEAGRAVIADVSDELGRRSPLRALTKEQLAQLSAVLTVAVGAIDGAEG
jgi:DNA-binding MarR family transcriptional regulator